MVIPFPPYIFWLIEILYIVLAYGVFLRRQYVIMWGRLRLKAANSYTEPSILLLSADIGTNNFKKRNTMTIFKLIKPPENLFHVF